MASDGAWFPARTVPRWVTGFRQNFVDHTASMAARGRACGSSGFVKISSKFRRPGFVKISSTDPPGFVKISSKLSTNLGRRSPVAEKNFFFGSSGFVKISSKFRQPGFVKISSTDPPGFVKISSKLSTNLGRRSPVAEKNFFFGSSGFVKISSKFRQPGFVKISSVQIWTNFDTARKFHRSPQIPHADSSGIVLIN